MEPLYNKNPMTIQVSKLQARRFLLQKQLLLPPPSLHGPHAVEQVFNHLRIIQYDPLNPCGRNPDLVLQSRILDYHPDDYKKWLYEEKKGIDCYDRELCIVPIEDFPLVSYRHKQTKKHDRIGPFVKKYQQKLEALLAYIDEHGPISSADIKDATRVDSGWGDTALFGRIALESLWRVGRLVIVRRDGTRKYYDLPHKQYALNHDPRYAKIQEEHVLRRVQAVGLLSKTGTAGGWQQLGKGAELSRIVNKLIKQKKLTEVAVEGSRRTFVIKTQDEDALRNAGDCEKHHMVFLAPLDNLVWDRQMLLELFDFDYRWEVYTPLAKRKYGYYVLPILCGDQLVGRIEPVLKGKTLHIKGIWPEMKWDAALKTEYEVAIDRFKTYLRATTIVRG